MLTYRSFLLALLVVLAMFIPAVSASAHTRHRHHRLDTCTQQVADWRYAWGDPDLQHITVTTSSCAQDAPWVILIHGGSWINGDRTSMYPATDIFYNAGWQVFNMDYRRGEDVTWRMQQNDLLAAYGWVTDHASTYNLDLSEGSVYGFSAGGHMAAWLGNAEPSLSSIVTVSGVLQPQRVAGDDNGARPDTEPTTPEMHNLHLREIDMMGCDWVSPEPPDPSCAANWDNFLPENTITPDSPPVFMLQGDLDPIVPHPTPDAYGWHLDQAGVGNRIIHDPNLGHTQHLFEDDLDRQTTILNWMRNQW